jgi:hypothetical protein
VQVLFAAFTAMSPLESTEHRSEARYRRLLRVRVGSLELTTANVSLHGLQLGCPIMRFERIKANVLRGELAAEVGLPSGAPVAATLAVRYCSQAGDEILVGTHLTVAAPDMQARWAAYVDELSGSPSAGAGSRPRATAAA